MSEPSKPPEPDRLWAVRELVECFADVLGEAPNFQTITARKGGLNFEVTIRRVGGKTPDEVIGELEAGRAALASLHLDHLKAAADREAGHLRGHTEARVKMVEMAAERDAFRDRVLWEWNQRIPNLYDEDVDGMLLRVVEDAGKG